MPQGRFIPHNINPNPTADGFSRQGELVTEKLVVSITIALCVDPAPLSVSAIVLEFSLNIEAKRENKSDKNKFRCLELERN